MARSVGNGRFELGEVAGQGGMGTVYRAVDRETEEVVAVKLLHGATDALRVRFEREGKVLAQLDDPHIVRYVAHGEVSAEELFLVMEWLDGDDLSVRLRQETLTIDETITIAQTVAAGLATAHAQGIVHRDIKPSNLFLLDGRIDRLKLLDFGVARLQGATVQATRVGQPIGTPSYMSPEQARGDADVDARSDLFSLGCLLYECLAGAPPFEADSLVATLARILFSPCEPVSERREETPPELAELIGGLLEKDREARPESARTVLEQLGGTGRVAARTMASNRHLGSTERRRLFVVVARRVDAPADDATLAADTQAVLISTAAAHTPVPARLSAVAVEHGAVIERLLDGSVVAVMSARAAASDAARRAARLALEIRSAVGPVPMALATGSAVIGGGLPWGAVIDRAVALSTAGEPGAGIRIDDGVVGLLDARFEVREDPAGAVLVDAPERAVPGRRLLGRASPCVGREREIGTVLGTLSESAFDSVARSVLVHAPPGVGKSRLLSEVLDRGAAAVDGLEQWLATADPLRAGSPFGMAANLVRGVAGVRTGDALDAQREHLRARLADGLNGDALEQVHVFLSEMLGIAPDEPAPILASARRDRRLLGDRMREAFVDFIDAETRRHPLMIAFDDLHWGDLPTVNCVDDCLRRLADRPLFVFALARPEIREVFPGLWSEHHPLDLPLRELSAKPRERLIRMVLEEVDDEVVARVSALSGGNAFYLEELIRAVAGGRTDLPESVLAMAQVRYEGLDAPARAVLRAGAVFGMVSWTEGIARLLGLEVEEVRSTVRGLVRDELLQPQPGGRFASAEQLEFRHALLREAAYAALTEPDRVLGHRLAAEWLRRAGENDAMVLAEQFERGGELAEAARWFRRAAEQALEGGDLDAARERARRGIECGASGEDLEQLLVTDVSAVRWQGAYDVLASVAREHAARLRPGSCAWLEVLGTAAVGVSPGEPLRMLGEIEPTPDTEDAYLVAAARLVTQWAIRGTNVDRPTDVIERLEAASRGELDSAIAGWLFEAQAFTAASEDRLQDTIDLLERSERAFGAAGDRRNALAQRVNLAFAWWEINAMDRAQEIAREAEVEARELGLGALVALASGIQAASKAWQAEDYVLMQRLRQRDIEAGVKRFEALAQSTLGHLLAGDLDGAQILVDQLHGLLNERKMPMGGVVAMVAVERGDYERALEVLEGVARRSLGLGTMLGMSAAIDDLSRVAANHGLGRAETARAELELALARVNRVLGTLHQPSRAGYLKRFDIVRLRTYAREYGLAFPEA
jgi:hypothetical protein